VRWISALGSAQPSSTFPPTPLVLAAGGVGGGEAATALQATTRLCSSRYPGGAYLHFTLF